MSEKKIREDLVKLDKRRRILQDVLTNIEDKKCTAIAKTYLSKCFKYHNSYSNGKKWWLYIKIVEVDGAKVIREEIQETCYGEIEISRKGIPIYDSSPFGMFDNSYIAIDDKEFQIAKEKILAKMIILQEE